MLLKSVQNTLKNEFYFLKESSRLLVAVSGGVDSVVLVHALHKLKYHISIAHCNFGLRGEESDEDANFVCEIAKELGVTLHYRKFDINTKGSVQLAARKARYSWFDELLRKNKLDYIAVAHHLDDSLETFLINLSRGTGLYGLLGIPYISGNIIRPIHRISKNDIVKYATKTRLKWREDSSNKKDIYRRNCLRNNVIPNLKKCDNNFLEKFLTTINHLKSTQNILDDYVILLKKDLFQPCENGYSISIKKLLKHSKLETYLYVLFSPYGFNYPEEIKKLLSADTGKKICSKSHIILKNREYLILQSINKSEDKTYKISQSDRIIKIPIELSIKKIPTPKHLKTDANTLLADLDKIEFPLLLRHREKGDIFTPLGMGMHRKKLSKYFKDEGYDFFEKSLQWLLCDAKNNIIWIVGKRPSDAFKITENTQRVLKIELFQNT